MNDEEMSMEDIEIRDQCYAEWKAMKQTKQACSECDSPMTNMSMSGRLPDWVCQECCLHDENDHGYCLECGKDIFDDLVGKADF